VYLDEIDPIDQQTHMNEEVKEEDGRYKEITGL